MIVKDFLQVMQSSRHLEESGRRSFPLAAQAGGAWGSERDLLLPRPSPGERPLSPEHWGPKMGTERKAGLQKARRQKPPSCALARTVVIRCTPTGPDYNRCAGIVRSHGTFSPYANGIHCRRESSKKVLNCPCQRVVTHLVGSAAESGGS